MLYLVVMVLNDPAHLEPLMERWTAVGASGITVLHSTGMGRLLGGWRRDDMPLFPSMRDLLEHDERHHRTLFTVVEQALVEPLIAAAQAVVGDLSQDNSGFLFTVPVERALGLRRA